MAFFTSSSTTNQHHLLLAVLIQPYIIMSLVSGPGRGGVSTGHVPDELKLAVEKHVEYIQSLDTVRSARATQEIGGSSFADSGKMSLSTG